MPVIFIFALLELYLLQVQAIKSDATVFQCVALWFWGLWNQS